MRRSCAVLGGLVLLSCTPQDPHRGFAATGPWVMFYGDSKDLDVPAVAAKYRVVSIDTDPGWNYWPGGTVETLRNGGKTKVLSYLNLGSCENYRTYWDTVPDGYVSCQANAKAQLGPYADYPDEVWMNPADSDYRTLLLGYVAPRLAASGIDGFFIDNVELLDHGTGTTNGPCDQACYEGGLQFIANLRERYPSKVIVFNHGTSARIRQSRVKGQRVADLIDGVHEEGTYFPDYQEALEAQLAAWRDEKLTPGGNKFFVGTTDYVGSCADKATARRILDQSGAQGFSASVSDSAHGLNVICDW